MRRDATRARILAAAWDLARRDGLAAITLRRSPARSACAPRRCTPTSGPRTRCMTRCTPKRPAARRDPDRPAAADDPRDTLRGRMRLFTGFCVADPVRYQMVFERPVPGFEPSPESFQITAAALAGTRADMSGRRRDRGAGPGHVPGVDHRAGLAAGRQRPRRRPLDPAARRRLRHVLRPLRRGTRSTAQPAGENKEQPMATSRHPPAASTADAFDHSHQSRMRSAVVEQIYRSAFGADYPAGAHPSAFYSATTLQLAVNALQLRPGNVVADLRCGTAGPAYGPPSRPGDPDRYRPFSGRHRAGPAAVGAARPVRAGPLPGGRPGRHRAARCVLRRRDQPGRAAVRPGQGRRRPRDRPDPAPGRPAGLHHLERLAHPAGDNPQRRALASTFHDHPLLQSARAYYRQLIENAGLTVEAYQEPPAGGPNSRPSPKGSSPPRRR